MSELVTPIPEQSGATEDAGGRRYTRAFHVVAASAMDALAVLGDEENIKRGSLYRDQQGDLDTTGYARCQSLRVAAVVDAPVNATGLYAVTAEYAWPNAVQFTANSVTKNAPRLWIERQQTTEPADIDRNGKPIANRVYQPVDPPLTKRSVTRVLCVEWLEEAVSWTSVFQQYAGYEEHVNSATYFGEPPGSFYCEPFEIEEQNTFGPAGNLQYRVVARFAYRPRRTYSFSPPDYITSASYTFDGWDDVFVHRGTRLLDDDNKLVELLSEDEDGNRVRISDPVNLSANGKLVLPDRAAPVLIGVKHYHEANFNEVIVL